MTIEDIRGLYAYDGWANRRLLAAARSLSADDFTRDLGSSYGSVKGTLVHILASKSFWLQLWLGESVDEVLRQEIEWEKAPFADAADLEARWSIEDLGLQQFIDGLTDERLQTRMTFEFVKGQPWTFSLADQMQHILNHSSYHRGQVVTLLRQLGHRPPATDLLEFLHLVAYGNTNKYKPLNSSNASGGSGE